MCAPCFFIIITYESGFELRKHESHKRLSKFKVINFNGYFGNLLLLLLLLFKPTPKLSKQLFI